MAEFLPLCDVLFTVISLAGYFCDVVFDLVMAWALAGRGRTLTCAATLCFVIFSLLVSQVVSLRWYLSTRAQRQAESNKQKTFYHTLTVYFAIGLHVLQCGVLWRYAKLFIPVDLRHVKHEVRDLCMLRLLHAFCEAAPMLLIQVYLLMCPPTDLPPSKPFSDLNVVSAALSLFSVCWALASFSKNVRLQNVHRLVLTWLGVIFQFMWRLGTVSARVTSLTIYASLYGYWVFLVIGLHWVSMFLWLISPKNVFHGERISKPRKACLSALIAFVYVFAYVNLQEVNHRQKMVTFYVVMLLENGLLVIAWLAGSWHDKPDDWYMIPLLVLGLFMAGIMFMLLYYRYFHVRRLGYEAGGRIPQQNSNNNYCISCNGICECDDNQVMPTNEKQSEIQIENAKNELTNNSGCIRMSSNRYHQHAIPGVFNCRFSNPVTVSATTKRKKKKPTTFVPPPTIGSLGQNIGPTPIPFWRRPLPTQHNHQGGSSENEGSSVGSRVNIHQKLQEKKQKQLAELKVIEEEIKQGKLGGPVLAPLSANDETFNSLPRQPIPRTKKHLEPICWPPPSPDIADFPDLADYSKNVSNYQENMSELNANINGNLNKLSNYKQNISDLPSIHLNNIGALNNLSYSNLLNNTSNRISPSQAYTTQNLNSLESLGSGHSSRSTQNQNAADIGGLSPIMGSDDNGSLPRQIVTRHLPRKAMLRSSRRRDDRVTSRLDDRQRTTNMSPRMDYSTMNEMNRSTHDSRIENSNKYSSNVVDSSRQNCNEASRNVCSETSRLGNDILNSRHPEINTRWDISDQRAMDQCSDIRHQQSCADSVVCRKREMYQETRREDRAALNVSPRDIDDVQNHRSCGTHYQTNDSNTRSSPHIHERLVCSDNSNQRTNVHSDSVHSCESNSRFCNDPRIVCSNYNGDTNRSLDVSHTRGLIQMNPKEVHDIYADYRGNVMREARVFPPQLPFPYHVVPPPKMKQAAGAPSNSPIRPQMNRSKTPEILLAPHYLDNSRVYYDWGDRGGQNSMYRLHDQHIMNDENSSTLQCHSNDLKEPNSVSDNENVNDPIDPHVNGLPNSMYKSCRVPSDIDSQISLPRSYTLPREFKYYRRGRTRKQIRNDHFIASTNSSDGDVDSGDDNDSDETSPIPNPIIHPQQNNITPTNSFDNDISAGINNPISIVHTKHLLRRPYAYRNQVKHETKL